MTRCAIVIAVTIATLAGGVNLMADDFDLLREGRPRLELTPEKLEALRADARAVRAAAEAADVVLEREYTQTYQGYFVSLPGAEFPPEHEDGWPYWTGIAGELRRYMEITAHAHALTGERKYLAWCRQLMLAVADWRQWTDPWYGEQPCLDTHHLTRGMSVALDLLWDDLAEQDRRKIIDAIADKGARFIHEHGNDPRSYVAAPGAWPNGYAMINSALGVAGLALLGEHEDAGRWLAQSLEKARLFFDEQGGMDGGLAEGFMYGSAAIDNLVYLVSKTEAIAGENIFDHPYLSQALFFPVYFMVPGGRSLANFGDNGGPDGCPPALLGLARALVDSQQCPTAAWYLQKAGESGTEIDALGEAPDYLPAARHFRDIDWVAMRSGWSDTGSLLAFKSGHVEHHNHLDQNSFILAWNDEWLLNDPGYQIYDRPYPPEHGMSPEVIHARHQYTYGTVGHNAILVDGEGQVAERGRIDGFFTSQAVDYLVGDASACYEGLHRYRRHIFSIPGEYYAVFEEIATDGPARRIEVLLHTTADGVFSVDGDAMETGERREGQWASIRRTGEAIARFVQPGRISFEHRQWPHARQYGHFLAASVDEVTEATLAWVLAAGPAGEVRVEARPVGAGLPVIQVRAADAVDTIALSSFDDVRAGRMSLIGAAGMLRESPGGLHRYALVRGTELERGESTLVESDVPVSVGVVIEDAHLRARLDCDERVSITLHCAIEPDTVLLDGIETTYVTFDAESATIALSLDPGSYELEVRGR